MRNISFIEFLPDGHAGTLRTLDVMRTLARRDYLSRFVSSTVRSILEKAPTPEPVPALYLFARDEIRYISDPPNIEFVQDFERCTKSRRGDCDDKCTWLATALLSMDCPCRFVVQSYDGTYLENGWDHVFVEYYDWEKWRWVSLDPTADGHTGFRAPVGWRQPITMHGAEMHMDV